jgi:RAT1-interacting protein
LRQPKELLSYSRTFDGDYVNDDSSLNYYFLPDSDVDTNIELEAGFSKFKKADESTDGDFDGLLGAIQEYESKNDTKVKAEIITWRGILTKFLTLPYNTKDPFFLNVVWFDGHIFIKEDKLKRNLHEQKPTLEHQKLMYSGYKFESIATIPKPLSQISRGALEKRFKKVVNNIEQYCSVVRTGVGKTKVIIGGEVDCVWDYKPEDSNPLGHYVELKTSKVINDPKDSVKFERKLYKTWAQTFLLGINKIIYGFRDENLVLRSVEQYQTEEIPVLLKSNPYNMNPNKINCIDSLKWYGAVIEWIAKEIPHDESKAWNLVYDPKVRSIVLSEADENISSSLLNGGIVTEKFKDWRIQRRESSK